MSGEARNGGCRVMILSDAIPNRNGVGTYYHDLMEHLAGRLEHVEMIPARANCIFKKNRVWIPMPGDHSQQLYFPNVLRILEQIRRERPDVVIVPTLGPFALLARLVCRYKKLPMVFGYHTSLNKLVQLYWQGHFGDFTAWYLKRASRVMFRQAEVVVVNTEAMRDEALALGAERVEVMGTTIAQPLAERPPAPAPERVGRVLFAGRLAKEKQVMRVAEAAEAMPEVVFRIAGEGPERAALEAVAAHCPNLQLLGWLDREALVREVDAADVVVLPSKHESFGSIALEAMARGRLMLVSGQCGILQWPELARGLCVIQGGESVTDALRRLRDMPAAELRAAGERAAACTRGMNARTLEGWMALLTGLKGGRGA
jgi:glycosyltransferase involved in cell wall biosynthesis